MNKLAFLYVTLSGARKLSAENPNDGTLNGIYREAFFSAIKNGCPYVEEGDLYLLSMFNDIFKIKKGNLKLKDRQDRSDPAFPEKKPQKKENSSEPSVSPKKDIHIPDSADDVIRSASRILHVRKERKDVPKISEKNAESDDDNPEKEAEKTKLSPSEIIGVYRNTHMVTVETYDFDTNTKERTLKHSEDLIITIYPMEIKESALSASIIATIENKRIRTVYTTGPEGKKSLICDFGNYSFIVRGSFEGGSFMTQVNLYNQSSENNRFSVTENDVVRETPDDPDCIGHCVLSIGSYQEHVFPLSYENNERGLCPFVLVNEHDEKKDATETGDLPYVLIKLGDQTYQIYASWTDTGTFRAEYKNVTEKMNAKS